MAEGAILPLCESAGSKVLWLTCKQCVCGCQYILRAIYDSARKLAASGDLPAFRQMWQVLQQQAPHFGDPHHLFLLAICNGHTNGVIDVAWAPDGTRIATASNDGTARVWEAATGKLLITCQDHTDRWDMWNDRVNAVAWSPDSARLATASFDKMTRVWRA